MKKLIYKKVSFENSDFPSDFLWEKVMPLVKIEIIKGKSLEYKKTVLDAVHVALENAIQIENWGLAGIQREG